MCTILELFRVLIVILYQQKKGLVAKKLVSSQKFERVIMATSRLIALHNVGNNVW